MPNTPNYNWNMPDLQADNNTWGSELNATITAIDAKVKQIDDSDAGKVSHANATQNLTLTQQENARTNVGITSWPSHQKKLEYGFARYQVVNGSSSGSPSSLVLAAVDVNKVIFLDFPDNVTQTTYWMNITFPSSGVSPGDRLSFVTQAENIYGSIVPRMTAFLSGNVFGFSAVTSQMRGGSNTTPNYATFVACNIPSGNASFPAGIWWFPVSG